MLTLLIYSISMLTLLIYSISMLTLLIYTCIRACVKGKLLNSAIPSPWDSSKCFTLHPLADLFIYTSPPDRPVPLHFTPWQTCSFTLQPLADLFIYTSPPGRPVPLHFTPWQTCSFTLHPLANLFLYTSPPGRPVHPNANATSLGSIQSSCI